VHTSLTLATALAAGVVAQSMAHHSRIPGIVLLLLSGVVLGPEVLGWIDPTTLGDSLNWIVDFGVAVILFEGGLNLERSRLRRQEASIRRLVTWGAMVTLGGGTLAAAMFLDWPWSRAFLFGSLVVVTGPTVVTPLVRQMRLHPRLRTILEAEGVFIDPIGAILAVLVLQVALVPATATFASELKYLLARLGFGIVAGIVFGLVVGFLLRLRWLIPKGYVNIFTLAAVILLFEGCNQVISQSGLLAVTLAGVVVGNMGTAVDRDLREFKDQLTVLLVGLIFVLLAADVRLADVRALGLPSVAVLAILVVLVRPLGVCLSTIGSRLTWRERCFVALVAPRGIVAAAVASATVVAMDGHSMPGGAELRAMVFLTIATSVVLCGLTARPAATILGVRLPGRNRAAILGAQGLGLALGTVLRDAGTPVVFVDSDPKRCRFAEEAGYSVIFGDGLEERTMQRAQVDLVDTAIGLTPNTHLNSIFVGQAKQLFGVPNGCIAVDVLPGDKAPDHVQRYEGQILFDGPHDAERWDVRWRHGELVTEAFVFNGTEPREPVASEPKPGSARGVERFVILAIRRGGRVMPMTVGTKLKNGDVASIAIYLTEREDALIQLLESGWNRLADVTDQGAAEAPVEPDDKRAG